MTKLSKYLLSPFLIVGGLTAAYYAGFSLPGFFGLWIAYIPLEFLYYEIKKKVEKNNMFETPNHLTEALEKMDDKKLFNLYKVCTSYKEPPVIMKAVRDEIENRGVQDETRRKN